MFQTSSFKQEIQNVEMKIATQKNKKMCHLFRNKLKVFKDIFMEKEFSDENQIINKSYCS